MYTRCRELGRDTCLPVYKEQLAPHTLRSLKLILAFLGIAWSVLEDLKSLSIYI